MKNLIAWFAGLFKKESAMSDDTVVQPTPVVTAPAAPAPAPVVIPPAAPAKTYALDTERLKNLLITLGHDIEDDWSHLLALASKVV